MVNRSLFRLSRQNNVQIVKLRSIYTPKQVGVVKQHVKNTVVVSAFERPGFSEDLMVYIISMLDIVSILKLSLTNSWLHRVIQTPFIWKILTERFFQDLPSSYAHSEPITIQPVQTRTLSRYRSLFKNSKARLSFRKRNTQPPPLPMRNNLHRSLEKHKFMELYNRKDFSETVAKLVPHWGVCPCCDNTLTDANNNRCACVVLRSKLSLSVMFFSTGNSESSDLNEGICTGKFGSLLSTLGEQFELEYKTMHSISCNALDHVDIMILDLSDAKQGLDLTEITLINDFVADGGLLIFNGYGFNNLSTPLLSELGVKQRLVTVKRNGLTSKTVVSPLKQSGKLNSFHVLHGPFGKAAHFTSFLNIEFDLNSQAKKMGGMHLTKSCNQVCYFKSTTAKKGQILITPNLDWLTSNDYGGLWSVKDNQVLFLNLVSKTVATR